MGLEVMVIVGAAAWRISAMLAYERGPGDVFLWFRGRLGIKHNDNGEPEAWPDSFMAKLIVCPWCVGVFAVFGMWGVWQVAPTVVFILGAMAMVPLIERWARGPS